MTRTPRSERLSRAIHALTAVALLSQGTAGLGEPATPRSLVVLPLAGGALALINAVFHRRLHAHARAIDVVSSLLEGLTCAAVGAASKARGTRYIHLVWFAASVLLIAGPFVKAAVRRRRAA